MFPYLVNTLIIVVIGLGISYKEDEENYRSLKEKSFFGVRLICIFLIIFSGLRGAFTADHQAYIDYFYYIKSTPVKDIFDLNKGFTMERGFVVLSKIIGFFTDSGTIYMLVLSAITIWLFNSSFKRYSEMPWLSLLLFASIGDYYATFNLTRQLLAAGLCFWGMRYLLGDSKRDFLKYFAVCLVAATIHKTALIMLPFYFLKRIKISDLNFILWIGVFLVVSILLPSILKVAQKIIPQYSNYEYGIFKGSINSVLPYLGVFAFVLSSKRFSNIDLTKPKNQISINGLLMTLYFLGFGVQLFIFSRFSHYFRAFACLIVPNVINQIKNEKMKKLLILLICAVSVIFVWVSLSGTGYDPYYLSKELF